MLNYKIQVHRLHVGKPTSDKTTLPSAKAYPLLLTKGKHGGWQGRIKKLHKVDNAYQVNACPLGGSG
jgi:hypothetical protein